MGFVCACVCKGAFFFKGVVWRNLKSYVPLIQVFLYNLPYKNVYMYTHLYNCIYTYIYKYIFIQMYACI